MKNLTRDIKSNFKQEGKAKHIIEIFSSLFNIPSYELMKEVWAKMCMLLLSPTFTSTVEKTLNYLVLTVTAEFKYADQDIRDVDEISEENVSKTKSFYESNNHKTIYESSPFYKDFNEIKKQTNSHLFTTNENPIF